jgi:hypothetical protein
VNGRIGKFQTKRPSDGLPGANLLAQTAVLAVSGCGHNRQTRFNGQAALRAGSRAQATAVTQGRINVRNRPNYSHHSSP